MSVKLTLTLPALLIILISGATLHAENIHHLDIDPSLSLQGPNHIIIAKNEALVVEDELDTDDFEDDFEDDDFDDDDFDDEELKGIADPLEPLNRVFFAFNDRLYFWVLKPVARGYNAVVPEKGRVGIGRFFTNLRTP
ncbi:MAG: VacJ family lipoprotein, partial [Proteobacteria bacterium]|nr:VacJ family lipoprotein [Pseudomonadota bacterium]